MALVVTLILLAVTLVMAVAFLAISRRERGSVTTQADTTTAKQAADAGLALAEAQIISDIFTSTNPYITRLYVSTNFINQIGFTNGVANPANVNYGYYYNAPGPLSAADFIQNVANLFYSPRPPVFFSNDFRFYLDLNRNQRYDTNGYVEDLNNQGTTNGFGTFSLQVGDPEWIGILEHPDAPHGPNNRFLARVCFIAVPADRLDVNHIHNQVAQQSSPSLSANADGYFRNQGIGTWEINLAAFLTDLNTNIWDPQAGGNFYQYNRVSGFANSGVAFVDAFDILTNRYLANYGLLGRVQNTFGVSGANAFNYGGADFYTEGPLQTTFDTNYSFYYLTANYPSLPWAGADNTNNYFTPGDLFNTNLTASFGIHLTNAGMTQVDGGVSGATVSTYDRYTFYRMLSQLGSDTAPESGKINVNYANAVVTYNSVNLDASTNVATSITIVPNAETNFISWQPRDFFTAAANQLLQAYSREWYITSPSNYVQTYYGLPLNHPPFSLPPFNYFTNIDGQQITNMAFAGQTNQIPSFGVTNIPVYVNGQFVYSSAVNRLLQLAANIYDSSTNKMSLTATLNPGGTTGVSNYPSVFRPVFWVTNEFNNVYSSFFTNVYIKGYQYVPYANGVGDPIFSPPLEVTALPFGISQSNVWGVPWILGAKKGFPNLDKAEIESSVFVERLLQFNRLNANPFPPSTPFKTISNGRVYSTNQMYIMGVSNFFGMVDANTYAEPYNNTVSVVARDSLQMGLVWTNENNIGSSAQNTFFSAQTNVFTPWPASSTTMLLGTNIFQYFLTAAGNTVLGNNFPLLSVPFLMNTANINWTTNASFVYYDTPVTKTFSGVPFTGPCFIPTFLDPSNFMDSGTPQMSQMFFSLTNRMQVYIVDSAGGILDYVQLGGMNSTININTNIADESQTPPGAPLYSQDLWSTNPFEGGTMPYGIFEQYRISSTVNAAPQVPPDADGGVWSVNPVGNSGLTSKTAQQAFCAAFFSADNEAFDANDGGRLGTTVSNVQLSMQAPFTPIRVSTQRFVYEANDPLVHYLASDMNDGSSNTNSLTKDSPILSKLSSPNDRYMPWGNPILNGQQNKMPGSYYSIPLDQTYYNLGYKDPLVVSPDNWDFPTNKYPAIGWLGRVHRGTPWQTVYLKSYDILGLTNQFSPLVGEATWQFWTGNLNSYDANNAAPRQDRLLFDLFTTAPSGDATRGRLSVNVGAEDPYNPMAGLAAWSALFSGTTAFTNYVANDITLQNFTRNQNPLPTQTGPGYTNLTVQPLGTPSSWPNGVMTNTAIWKIVQSINSTRTNYVGIDGLSNAFEHIGDILSVPALSTASPYLNTASTIEKEKNISDEMYEWLPQQVMSLLTISGTPQSPPRYVVYCYGQTLKPAANGIVASGNFFGLCTNYQVVAEFGSRAVIRVDNTPTPANPAAAPHVVIEQYNPLPPD